MGTRSGLLRITETPPAYGLNLHHGFKKRDCPAETRAQTVLMLVEPAPPGHWAEELGPGSESQRLCLGLGNGCHTCLLIPFRGPNAALMKAALPQDVQTAGGGRGPQEGSEGGSHLRPPPPMPGPAGRVWVQRCLALPHWFSKVGGEVAPTRVPLARSGEVLGCHI